MAVKPEKLAYQRKYQRAWYHRNLDKARKQGRRHKVKQDYGLTLEEYERIVARPCEICGEQKEKRFLDHNHTTGENRGPLCRACNTSIALFREDLHIMARAIEYLRRYNGS